MVTAMHGSDTTAQGMSDDQIAYKIRDAARVLAVGERTVWQLVMDEERKPGSGIESIKVGRSRRIPRAALLAYVEKLRAA